MMKKLKLLLLPIMILSLTACGTKTDTKNNDNQTNNNTTPNELQAMAEKINSAKSVHLDYKIDMAFKSEGIEMEMPVSMSMDLDNETKLAKAAVTVSILGMNITVNEYMDLTNNIMYLEDPENGTWTKQKTSPMSTSDMIASFANAKKVDDNDNEYHYQATVTPNDFQNNLSLAGSTTDGLSLNKDVIVNIYVSKSDDEIRMEADLTDSIELEEDVEYTTLKFTMAFNNLNNAGVKEIDQSIIDNAVEE